MKNQVQENGKNRNKNTIYRNRWITKQINMHPERFVLLKCCRRVNCVQCSGKIKWKKKWKSIRKHLVSRNYYFRITKTEVTEVGDDENWGEIINIEWAWCDYRTFEGWEKAISYDINCGHFDCRYPLICWNDLKLIEDTFFFGMISIRTFLPSEW